MIKEYKQIYVTVGDMVTMNFKKAFAEANKKGITQLIFTWSSDTRLSAEEFEARIVKVVEGLTDWEFTHKLITSSRLEVNIINKPDNNQEV